MLILPVAASYAHHRRTPRLQWRDVRATHGGVRAGANWPCTHGHSLHRDIAIRAGAVCLSGERKAFGRMSASQGCVGAT
jgi:hypothetical protein